ncbi:MAG: hypothetical protein RLZZ399_869 [Verrucomicrobiota bacterium]|jgi:hypothetical protein
MLQSKLLRTLLTLASLSAAAPTHADLVLEYTHSGLMAGKQTLSIQDSKCRADFEGGMLAGLSVIMTPGNDSVYLHHPSKALYRVSPEEMQRQFENSPAAQMVKESLNTKPQPTGKTETIEGYETEIYTLKSNLMEANFWVAKNFPQFDQIQAAFRSMERFASPNNPITGGIHSLPGLIVQSETNSFGIKQTQKLVSSKESPLRAELFDAPQNYQPASSFEAIITAGIQSPKASDPLQKTLESTFFENLFQSLVVKQLEEPVKSRVPSGNGAPTQEDLQKLFADQLQKTLESTFENLFQSPDFKQLQELVKSRVSSGNGAPSPEDLQKLFADPELSKALQKALQSGSSKSPESPEQKKR